jgi:hypothetical protein
MSRADRAQIGGELCRYRANRGEARLTSLPPPGYSHHPVSAEGPPLPYPAAPAAARGRRLLRALAVVGVLIGLLFTIGFVRGAANNARYPACSDIAAGRAAMPIDGKCFKSDAWQADLALVLAWSAALAVAAAALASLRFLLKASHGLLVLRLLGTGVGLLVLTILVTRA